MIDPQTQRLNAARLGIQLKEAQGTILWGFLMSRAADEALDATGKLATIDPHKWQEIQALQNDIKRWNDLKTWMEAAIQQGEQAEAEFDATQDHQS